MSTAKISMAELMRSTIRRHGWRCLAFLLVLELMHYWRHGAFDLTDVRDGLIALCVFAAVSLVLEANRLANLQDGRSD